MTRPFDLLEKSVGKRVIVHCKNGQSFSGKLVSFDLHLNVWLSETSQDLCDAGQVKYGDVVIRGDMIVMMSPVTEEVK